MFWLFLLTRYSLFIYILKKQQSSKPQAKQEEEGEEEGSEEEGSEEGETDEETEEDEDEGETAVKSKDKVENLVKLEKEDAVKKEESEKMVSFYLFGAP